MKILFIDDCSISNARHVVDEGVCKWAESDNLSAFR